MRIGRRSLAAPLLAAGLLFLTALPAAAEGGHQDNNGIAAGGLALSISTISVQQTSAVLKLAVRNTTDHECSLPAIPDGSLSITALERDGRPVLPLLGSRNYIDGVGSEIADSLQPIAPGATIEVSIGKPYSGKAALDSVNYSMTGPPLESIWLVDTAGHYRLTALYSVPDLDERTESACTGTAQLTTEFDVGGSGLTQALLVGAVVVGLVLAVIAVAAFLLIRRRRSNRLLPPPPAPPPTLLPPPPPPAFVVALLVAGLLAAELAAAPPIRAVIEVANNPQMAAIVNGCLGQFRAPGGDPAGIIARLDALPQKVRIQEISIGKPSTDTSSPAEAKRGQPVDSTVNFNPDASFNFSDGIAYEHCSALYHELSHALDLSTGKDTSAGCGSTGIPLVEVRATLIENQWRVSHGLKPRKEYDKKTLPASENDCKPKPKGGRSKRGVECDDDCGGSNGDPHLDTYDRAFYDFQAVGEFILSRTADRTFEVQARQVAFPGSRTVSVDSAFAFGVAGDRVGIYAGSIGNRDSTQALRVVVNGASTTVDTTLSLPNGGSIEPLDGDHGMSYVISWPDGSAAWVNPVSRWGVRVEIDPSDDIRGQLQGLLGNADGFKLNDYVTRDGKAVDSVKSREQLYGVLGQGWRVQQAESLFDYGAGESTQTFTDQAFPAEIIEVEQMPDLELLRQICGDAGAITEEYVQQCIIDIGLTGQWDFGDTAAEGEATNHPAEGQEPGPTPSGPVPTATIGQIEGVTRLASQALAADGTLYVSVSLSGGQSQVQAIDPASGNVLRSVDAQGTGQLAYAGDAVWVAGFDGKAGFGGATGCSIVKLDPATLAPKVTVDASCGVYAPTFAGAGDSIWYVDTTAVDSEGNGARLTRADPQTGKATTDAIAMPFRGGFLASTNAAIFYYDFGSQQPVYRFHPGDTTWQSLGTHGFGYFGGDGVWASEDDVAAFYTSDGAPEATIPIEGTLVGGGDRGPYASTSGDDFVDVLALFPLDRTPPLQLAAAPIVPSDPTDHFSYFLAQLAFNDTGIAALWNDVPDSGQASLVTQWIPLP